MAPTGLEGAPIVVRPIGASELDRIVLRCWPDREAIDRLFETQGTIGFAAWDGDRCVAQLQGYRIHLPDGDTPLWPDWNNWWHDHPEAQHFVTDLLRRSTPSKIWCHACLHVGRTKERITEEEGKAGRAKGIYAGIDTRYQGRGIGTAMIRASVAWARDQGYDAVLGLGAPAGLYTYASWAGTMSWTTYARLGFASVMILGDAERMPAWAAGDAPPEVAAEAEVAISEGRPAVDFHEHLMMKKLVEVEG